MKRRTFVQIIISGSGFVFLNSEKVIGNIEKNTMKISMIYNNIGESATLKNAWGLAVWIEDENEALLFDTGGEASTFMENVENVNLNLNKLSKIVISHNHWDHTTGLAEILKKTNYQPKVYVPVHDITEFESEFPKARIKGIDNPFALTSTISTTGQLVDTTGQNDIHEISLTITHQKSLYLLTGCSHSGIVSMVEHVKNIHPFKNIELVIGGFHLNSHPDNEVMRISESLMKLGVKNLAASHCTGESAIKIFKKEWGKQFIDFNLGDELSI